MGSLHGHAVTATLADEDGTGTSPLKRLALTIDGEVVQVRDVVIDPQGLVETLARSRSARATAQAEYARALAGLSANARRVVDIYDRTVGASEPHISRRVDLVHALSVAASMRFDSDVPSVDRAAVRQAFAGLEAEWASAGRALAHAGDFTSASELVMSGLAIIRTPSDLAIRAELAAWVTRRIDEHKVRLVDHIARDCEDVTALADQASFGIGHYDYYSPRDFARLRHAHQDLFEVAVPHMSPRLHDINAPYLLQS